VGEAPGWFLVSKVRRDAVRAGLVAVAGVFSGTRGCLAFFASRLAPTGFGVHLRD